MLKKKKQTAVRGKSSALLISIAIHVILFFIAGAYVAVEVIQRSETKFEGKQIVRPKMKLKKLQVPVKIEQKAKRQAPKLSQRVTAAKNMKTKSVEFKMPEMTGFGGGTGVNVSSVGFGGSLGFATTQLNVFGLKSTGEKILFMLDTSNDMLSDEIGGILAYKIIKDELINLIGHLPPTALFNVIIFDRYDNRAFSEELSTASDLNIKNLTEWLDPLNSQKNKYGFKTLSSEGVSIDFERMAPIYNNQKSWLAGLSYGIRKGVDSIYWLGRYDTVEPIYTPALEAYKRGEEPTEVDDRGHYDLETFGKERWAELRAAAQTEYEAENARRAAAGQPMMVIPGNGSPAAFVHAIFPKEDTPEWVAPLGGKTQYAATDVLHYMEALGAKYSEQDRRDVSIGLKEKKLSFNVIHFVPRGKDADTKLHCLRYIAEELDGEYLQIRGMRAIESAATAGK